MGASSPLQGFRGLVDFVHICGNRIRIYEIIERYIKISAAEISDSVSSCDGGVQYVSSDGRQQRISAASSRLSFGSILQRHIAGSFPARGVTNEVDSSSFAINDVKAVYQVLGDIRHKPKQGVCIPTASSFFSHFSNSADDSHYLNSVRQFSMSKQVISLWKSSSNPSGSWRQSCSFM